MYTKFVSKIYVKNIYQITKRVFASFISKNSFCYLIDDYIPGSLNKLRHSKSPRSRP